MSATICLLTEHTGHQVKWRPDKSGTGPKTRCALSTAFAASHQCAVSRDNNSSVTLTGSVARLGMTENACLAPLWTQDQAIAYEAALEAINDVIAGYSEQIAIEHGRLKPDMPLIEWLEMRTDQAVARMESLNVTDTDIVHQALNEFSGIVRNRDISH